jgi:S-DNA-T family DNA segregation ATPase FtsK/SpoIIIE
MSLRNERKSRRDASQRKTSRMKRSDRSFEFGALFRLCQILLAAFLLYVTASLFTTGVGILGKDMASCILRYAGGGVILLLLHFFYGLFCSLLGRHVSSVFSQWLGTFCLYGALSLFLGLLKNTWFHTEIGLLSPGIIGSAASLVLPRLIGAIGTILVGISLVFLAAFNYGYLKSERIKGLKNWFVSLPLPSFHRSSQLETEDNGPDAGEIRDISQDLTDSSFNPAADSDSETIGNEADDFAEFTEADHISEERAAAGETESKENGSILTAIGAVVKGLFGRSSDESEYEDAEQDETANTSETTTAEQIEDAAQEKDFTPEDVGSTENESSDQSEESELADAEPETVLPSDEQPELTPKMKNTTEAKNENASDEDVPITKGAEVQIDPSGALHGTEEVDFIGGREIPKGSFPPPLDLLGPHQEVKEAIDDQKARENGQEVIKTLGNFDVSAELKHTIIGPTVVQYQIQLAAGIKVSKVSALGNDIAVALGVPSIRVEAPIPGTSYIGIELPNAHRRAVPLRQIIESEVFQNTKLCLPLPLGQTVDGRILISGLEELPHLLIAGTTGSGKSIFINNCIVAMCYHNTPSDLRFIMVDPKRVEMGIYESLPHILAKPIVTASGAVHALAWAVKEMERRYNACSMIKARSIASYNEKVLPKDRMPHIVIIVDELADLMMTAQKEVEEYIMRLAQMARAVGIHLMLATQRPSVNVLTGTIKANIPARVSFSLPSVADSRTILDVSGAQNLLGKGDMLFVSTRHPHPLRIQSPFMDEQTNIRVVEYLRNTFGDPEYVDLEEQEDEKGNSGNSHFLEDSRLEEAIKIVLSTGVASSSGLQRQMRIGFTRAARMIDTMESMGIVGPQNGAKPREILVDEGEALEILEQYREGR